jgi:phage minor structural protein
MIKVFDKFETEFNNNGLQILDDYIIDPEVYEILNGIYSLTFKYPIFCTKHLEEENIITAYTPKNEDQPFRISKINKEFGFYNVTAYHIFYDLADNLIEDINIVTHSGTNAIEKISAGTQYSHPFKMFSDINKTANCRIVRYNIVQALLDSSQDNTFISRWGGEIERNNYNITMHKRLGTNRGTQIRYKKNLIGYEADIDYTQVATRIMPKGYDGLLLPEKYVDSDNIDYYPHPKIRLIEYGNIKAIKEDGENASNEEGAVPLDEAYQMLREAAKSEYEVNHIDIPKANYKVDFVELSSTEEYKNIQVLEKVYLGDTVNVIHEDENLDITARVISYKFNPLTKKYNEIEIGNYQKSFTDIVGKLNDLHGKVEDVEGSMLDLAKNNATELINNGFGGFVRIHPDRILIMDTENEGTAKNVWQWNKNGLGYSSTGINGPYGLAMTNDGSIVADFITSGVLNANIIRAGTIDGKNFNLDLDSGLMQFGTGAIDSEALTGDLKEELKGEKGPQGTPGKDGMPGKDGSLADFPSALKAWNDGATQISGEYVYTPELFSGSGINGNKTGIYIGERLKARQDDESSNYTYEGITGLYNGVITSHFGVDGSGFIGRYPDNRITWDKYGDMTIPEITTDMIYGGTNKRIILVPGYSPGENDAPSIDANPYNGKDAIRIKVNAYIYLLIHSRGIAFYGTDGIYLAVDSYKSTNGRIGETTMYGELLVKGSIHANSHIYTDGNFYSQGNYVGSDSRLKENIKFLEHSDVLRKTDGSVDKDIKYSDLYDFIKTMNLATYNFKDSDKSQVSPITQNIKNEKLRDTIITRHDGYEHINQYAFISVIAGALKEEITKSEEKDKKIIELETRLEKIEKLLNL